MSKPFLSPSSLSVFKDCPRCFWLDRNLKLGRPRGIFPSLPGGVDEVMKKYHDSYRPLDQTPFMIQETDGVKLFPDQNAMNKFRNWRTGLRIETPEFVCSGAVDDIAVEKDGKFSPYDFKSKGKEPDNDYPGKYYQTQVDVYALMMEENGMPTSGIAYFRFAWPEFDPKTDDGIRMKGKIITLSTDTNRAREIIRSAVECLSQPHAPESSEFCEHCGWLEKRRAAGY
jgi:hypothetical protein